MAANLGVRLDGGRLKEQVNFAIITAIINARYRPFRWNVGNLVITPLVVDQGVYVKGATASDLPQDFLRLEHQDLWIQDTSISEHNRRKMEAWTLLEYEWARTGGDGGENTGMPRGFHFFGEEMRIFPVPDVVTYKIFGAYLIDVGQPVKTFTDPNWTFSADSFTNAWFELDQGYELITMGACSLLATGYLKDTEAGQRWRSVEQGVLQSEVIIEQQNRSPRRVSGHWPGA